MRPLEHGYTNRTLSDGSVVEKHYEGPDAPFRFEREHRVLSRLGGHFPVPPVLGARDGTLELGFVAGTPGQVLLDSDAAAVLRSCGAVLRQLHSLPTELVGLGDAGTASVVVHGDFGPNNLLLDPRTFEVSAVLDWEFAGLGDPVEDLAWCEWIVRMHHPEHVGSLWHCFDAYGGPVPGWTARRAVMLDRCSALELFCRRWEGNESGVAVWQRRREITAGWTE